MDTKCFTGSSVMSDNTLVIQSINGGLNVVLTRMEEVHGTFKERTIILADFLAETLELSNEPNSNQIRKLAELGWMVNELVSQLEVGK